MSKKSQTHTHTHPSPNDDGHILSRPPSTPPPNLDSPPTFSMSFIGSSLWCLQNSITLASTLFLTLGKGISWVSVLSSSAGGGRRGGGKKEGAGGECGVFVRRQ